VLSNVLWKKRDRFETIENSEKRSGVTFFFPTTWSVAAISCSLHQLVDIGFLASFGVGIGIGIGIDGFYLAFSRFFLDRVAPLPEPCEQRHARLLSIPIPIPIPSPSSSGASERGQPVVYRANILFHHNSQDPVFQHSFALRDERIELSSNKRYYFFPVSPIIPVSPITPISPIIRSAPRERFNSLRSLTNDVILVIFSKTSVRTVPGPGMFGSPPPP